MVKPLKTIKDIKRLIQNELGYCTDCILKRENKTCPFLLGDPHFCGLDCVIIAIDYIDRGEYYG